MKYIKIIKLKKIYNKKGNIIKYLNKNDIYFKKISEVYFTEILLNQAQGLTSQAQGLANQAQGQANSLLAQARTAVSQVT